MSKKRFKALGKEENNRNKKIFKALGAGLKLFVERNAEVLAGFVIIIAILLTTILIGVIMKMLGILSPASAIFIPVIAFIGVPIIIGSVIHAREAVIYSEEMKCSMEEAWKATATPEPDEDF